MREVLLLDSGIREVCSWNPESEKFCSWNPESENFCSWIPESEKLCSWIPESEKFCPWNPESGKILPVESRIMDFGIWNLTNDWSPESKSHQQRLEFSAWNLESMAWNLESETILDSLTFKWNTRIMTREIFFGTSIANFNFPLKTNGLSWSQSICFSYFQSLSPTPS